MVPNDTPASRPRRAWSGPALLSLGFRPFFFFAGLWAVVSLPLALAAIYGGLTLPSVFDPIAWHAHELLFGYTAAVMAGFLLTAIPNWTGRLPLQGWPLLGLACRWLAGRGAMAFSALLGPWLAAAIDVAFLFVFAAIVLREIIAGRNWRNLPPVLAVVVFALANAGSHIAALGEMDTGGMETRLAILVPLGLITMIGGRIVPSFTRNWLAKRGATALPAPFSRFDGAVLILTLAALTAWVVAPESVATGALMALAAAGNLIRLGRWRGQATGAEPLVWSLHLAYLWIPMGLGLIAVSVWWPALPQSAAIHALTAGAIGSMTLAVMSRATLGHSGRALHAGAGLTAAYLLVTFAALGRVTAPLAGAYETPLLGLAALAWIAAFALFLIVCGSALFGRRPS
jgi:uncharacterized protein involved in response to NO